MFRDQGNRCPTVHWFRHGLRLHDNPAMLEAVRDSTEFFAVFIFDGQSAGTSHVGYNRMKFLLESLKDLDAQLKKHGGRLYTFKGNPTNVFRRLWEELGIKKICFEQDCEPIWSERDKSVVEMCSELGIECVEKVSHTLWDPKLVIRTNGGIPPLTYQMFMHTTSVIGPPPRPCSEIDFDRVHFGVVPPYLWQELGVLNDIPTPEDFGLEKEKGNKLVIWVGGETRALKHLESRVQVCI
ncbi:hypothetical protein GE061_006996 [Apolygus lucorum]|uniref:Uncharacterized protein n=1 Tax=Apolygus lucorum TaxID=248454 RepID=A0A6A4J5L3_APOLU|nr:hypothetical protein GE061_006996 [Apolygus lucorum]